MGHGKNAGIRRSRPMIQSRSILEWGMAKMQVYGAVVHDKMRSILEWGMADGIQCKIKAEGNKMQIEMLKARYTVQQ